MAPTKTNEDARNLLTLSPAIVAGSAGGFGRLFMRDLQAEGLRVEGVDLVAGHEGSHVADIGAPSSSLSDLLQQCSLLLLCVPEEAAFRALEHAVPLLPSGALVVDLMSVKSPVMKCYKMMRQDIEVVSINPMFAPDLGWSAQQVGVVEVRSGVRSSAFLQMLRTWEVLPMRMSAEEHDRQTAFTQVVVHAALLALGLAASKLNYDAQSALLTPPARAMLTLLARIATKEPGVYFHIQSDHPKASEARALLAEALAEVDRTARLGTIDDFAKMLQRAASSLGGAKERLAMESAASLHKASEATR